MLLDSNIIIYSTLPEFSNLRKYLKKNESKLVVSEISKLEVLGYNKLSMNERISFEFFFQNVTMISIDHFVIDKAIVLRQIKKMSLGDSIIAASAIVNNRKVLTNNEVDFLHIPELQLVTLKSIL